MQNRTVMGIFDRPDDAEKLKEELLEAGIARHRIVISRLVTEDGIAAEAPGQSYENQHAGDEAFVGEVPDPEKFAEAVRRSACVVSVVARSPIDKQQIARLMRRHGARQTVETRSR
ncbi:MAG TPA: hypothetical protein VHJ82_09795 [Actinomycetota bacterium]|nr:hypothetical protein [Actinomycetota bacterium]